MTGLSNNFSQMLRTCSYSTTPSTIHRMHGITLVVQKSMVHVVSPGNKQASTALISKTLSSNMHNCICAFGIIPTRYLSITPISQQQQRQKPTKSTSKTVTVSSSSTGAVTLSLGEKVKENAKTASYGGIILLGVGVAGAMLYVLLSELFSQNSPNNIYTRSFKLCKLNQELQDALGMPVKCYGEETRRGWRRHVAHTEFLQNNVKHIRMRFYIQGTFRKGTVHVEKKENARGNYEYNYIIVDVDGYPSRQINVDC